MLGSGIGIYLVIYLIYQKISLLIVSVSFIMLLYVSYMLFDI